MPEQQHGHLVQRVLLFLDETFTDSRLCAAIVDRLTFGGNIIETGTDSYRLAQARARARANSGRE
ncbi:ATP-binding protein [Nonomuraea sp. KM90]|uniref:ATP-binding protein n=1 Tax=Nonomuraea sp. KM90 TaxID=3457428 RepID=UPI003FCEA3F7